MGNETLVPFINVEIKDQSTQWIHTHLPNKLTKFKQMSARKLMATVFWGKKRVLMVEFVQRRTAVTSQIYYYTLQNKRRGVVTSGAVLLHDSARPYTAAHT
jgi:hypothetical protein